MHIVIVGGGTAGWMAANLFVKKWSKEKVKVTLVESPEIGIVGVGEGSTPTLKRFFEMVEVPESEWMPSCNATYKVSIRFAGWSPGSGVAEYSHPFFSQVDTFSQRPFIVNCLTRRMGLDVNTQPEDFFINGVLARQGKGPITPDSFPFNMEYGYHFDSALLGEFLSELAVGRGVDHLQGRVSEVSRTDDGDINVLTLETGEQISGDFFVDCTGFASVLMQKTLGVPFNSFKDNLFNDSAVVMPTPVADDIPVETVSKALSSGWCWKIPLLNRFGNGYVYSSDFISSEEAEAEFRQHLIAEAEEKGLPALGLGGESLLDGECRHLKMRVGQLESHWSQNCLALGLSQGFIEPLEATALHLVQITVEMFCIKFAEGQFGPEKRSEFNTDIVRRFDHVRDYIVAHYKLNTRDDSEYWKANRDNNHLSESLLQILDVWYRRGDVSAELTRQKLQTHFGTNSWHCLLAGYGAFPPLAEGQPGKGDRYIEAGVQKFLEGCALNYRSLKENLSRFDA